MDLDQQKNFYDKRRYFQGKDNPDDAHPAAESSALPLGHIIFGLLFLGFVAALFVLRVHQENAPSPKALLAQPAAPAAPPAAAPKK